MNLLNSIVKKIRLHQTYLLEVVHFWRLTVKYNATTILMKILRKCNILFLVKRILLKRGCP